MWTLFSGLGGRDGGRSLPPDRVPIRAARELLHEHDYLVAAIRRRASVSDRQWNELFQPLLDALARFAQQLPASPESGEVTGGFLRHLLDGALCFLEGRRCLFEAGEGECRGAQRDLKNYALFSGALLNPLGRVLLRWRVELFDREGRRLGWWEPARGAMVENHPSAAFYRFDCWDLSQGEGGELVLMLVRELIPREAVARLASDGQIFRTWCAMVVGGGKAVGTEREGLPLADAPRLPTISTDLTLEVVRDLLMEESGGKGVRYLGDEVWLSEPLLEKACARIDLERKGMVPMTSSRLIHQLYLSDLLVAQGEGPVRSLSTEDGIPRSEVGLKLSRLYPGGPNSPGYPRPPEAGGLGAPTSPTPQEACSVREPETQGDAGADRLELRFVRWLRGGVTSGRIAINRDNSRVWAVPEGLLLVSPIIFMEFEPAEWERAQNRFAKLRIHLRRPDGTNFHAYRFSGRKGVTLLHGYLVPDPAVLLPGVPLPLADGRLIKAD